MHKGVYELPSNNFQAKTTLDNRRYTLGTYARETDAVEAIKLFLRNASERDHAEKEEIAKTLRENARVMLRHPDTPRIKTNTMRQDVRSCLARIAELEKQIELLQLRVNGGNQQ